MMTLFSAMIDAILFLQALFRGFLFCSAGQASLPGFSHHLFCLLLCDLSVHSQRVQASDYVTLSPRSQLRLYSSVHLYAPAGISPVDSWRRCAASSSTDRLSAFQIPALADFHSFCMLPASGVLQQRQQAA